MRTFITKEDKEAIAERIRADDATFREIATEFGVGAQTISNVAREYGLSKRPKQRKPRKTPEERIAIANEFLTDKLTASEIAEKHGASTNTVLSIARRIHPHIDLKARGMRLSIKARHGERSTTEDAKSKVEIARKRREQLKACPREQKVEQSKKAIGGNDFWRIEPAMTWEQVSEVLQRRYEQGEEELHGSFDHKTLPYIAMKALKKLRTVLEQYEFPEDTPNRRHDHLHETV